jgi:hypothetical protein
VLKTLPSPCCPPKNSWKNGPGILLRIGSPVEQAPPFPFCPCCQLGENRAAQVAWKRVVQQVLSLLGAAGAVQAHAFLALKMCAWCPWVSCWPKGACSCCPWRNCRVVKVMCCCQAAPAFPFHVAARHGLLHREKVSCGLFRSCRSCPSGWRGAASSFCCRPTFASFERGTRKGRQEGEVLPSTLQAAVQQLL